MGPLYFAGATTAIQINKSAAAVDVSALLHAADLETGKTITWSQAMPPSNGGALVFTNATASTGSADITPGGSITYQPAANFGGTETFTVQVSD